MGSKSIDATYHVESSRLKQHLAQGREARISVAEYGHSAAKDLSTSIRLSVDRSGDRHASKQRRWNFGESVAIFWEIRTAGSNITKTYRHRPQGWLQ